MIKPVFKISLLILLTAAISLPLTFILNIILNPFWLWFESSSGIEASGHSGPADWTFVFIYLLFITISILVYCLKYKNKSKKQI